MEQISENIQNTKRLFNLQKRFLKQQAAWNHHLLTLATGALTLLTIFHSNTAADIPDLHRYLLATTWVLLGKAY